MKRIETIKQVYDEAVYNVASSKHEWQKFLVFSSILYKYKFQDALLIYAQRPDATLVADMNTWNRRTGRYVNRGAKAIAVFDIILL